jgi:hypothetical protein
MVVSIPVNHEEAPPISGLVRARYESVEIIRELPRPEVTSQSTPALSNIPKLGKQERASRDRGSTIGFAESRGSSAKGERIDKLDSGSTVPNPVEWIMITRSDPGGGIPRFMVERGTPAAIAGDAVKFLDWAAAKDVVAVEEEDEDDTQSDVGSLRTVNTLEVPLISRRLSDSSTFEPSQATDTGVISSLTRAVLAGIDHYTPESVSEGLQSVFPHSQANEEDGLGDSTETSSMESFASAEQYTTAPDGVPGGIPEHMRHDRGLSSSTTSLGSNVAADKEMEQVDSRLEKELTRLEAKKKELDTRYAKAIEREDAKANDQLSKEQKDADKIRERLERETKKQTERHARELKKLEVKRQREEQKAEEKRKKSAEADVITRITRDRDQAKRIAEVRRQENEVWKERVGDLQRQNTLLVSRVSKLEGGRELLQEIRADSAAISSQLGSKKRSVSPSSGKSGKSGKSGMSGKSKNSGTT